MLNEAHLEKISKLIKTSKILTEQERTDWLTLLELMNDKQLAELEEILGAETIQPSAPVSGLSKPVASNLANNSKQSDASAGNKQVKRINPDISQGNQPQPVRTPSIRPIPPKPIQSKPSPQPPGSDVSLPGQPPVTANASQNISGITPLRHIQNLPSQLSVTQTETATGQSDSSDIANRSVDKDTTSQNQPQNQNKQAIKTRPSHISQGSPATPVQLNSYKDIRNLNYQTMISGSFSSLLESLKKLAEQNGYFVVLNEFEQSPLYNDYLEYGKQALSGGVASSNSNLTQEQFSRVTDILLALKVNRS